VVSLIAEEEMAAGGSRDQARRVLAGRSARRHKEFIKKNGEFTVNIALIVDRRPLLGVVGAPAFDRLWRGLRSPSDSYAEEISKARSSASRRGWRRARASHLRFRFRSHASWKNHDLEGFLEPFRIASASRPDRR